MSSTALALVVLVAVTGQTNGRTGAAAPVRADELSRLRTSYQRLWGEELVLKFESLPVEGSAEDFRVPYSGHDYPDKIGGTIAPLRKYDQAFHGGRSLAAGYEKSDIEDHAKTKKREPGRGLIGRLRGPVTPGWYGHCNGWTAATIRHAEPSQNVVRNGVTFTPADIKGLLAEMYMYTSTEALGGTSDIVSPVALHLTLTNWIGRKSHPVGMESAVGEVVINFPVYAFKSQVTRRSARQVDVATTITYTMHVGREMDKSEHHKQTLYFHYGLDLDSDGAIQSGRYYGDSGRIDMLWLPLKPTQGGQAGNERGNPHMDIREVLSLWRDSVPADVRAKWVVADPVDEDRHESQKKPAAETTATAAGSATGAAAADEEKTEKDSKDSQDDKNK